MTGSFDGKPNTPKGSDNPEKETFFSEKMKKNVEKIENVEDKIKFIVSIVFEVDIEKVTDEAKFRDDLGADSLDKAFLILLCERLLGVSISNEELSEIDTVGRIVECIKKKTT